MPAYKSRKKVGEEPRVDGRCNRRYERTASEQMLDATSIRFVPGVDKKRGSWQEDHPATRDEGKPREDATSIYFNQSFISSWLKAIAIFANSVHLQSTLCLIWTLWGIVTMFELQKNSKYRDSN